MTATYTSKLGDSTGATRGAFGTALRWSALAAVVAALLILGTAPTVPPGTDEQGLAATVQIAFILRISLAVLGLVVALSSRRSYAADWTRFRSSWAMRDGVIPEALLAFFCFAAGGAAIAMTLDRVAVAWAVGAPIWAATSDVAGPILHIVAVWTGASVVLIGLGLVFADRSPVAVADWGVAFFVGWAVFLVWLVAWHIFARIDGLVWSVPAVAAVYGWAKNRRDVFATLRAPESGWVVLSLTVGAVWIANRALAGPRLPDFGFYHLPAIKWALAYPAVPGLGNLHGRLAFNNASLLFSSALDIGWRGNSHLLAHGLLFLAACARSVAALGKLWRGVAGTADVVVAALLPVLVFWASGPFVSSHAPDASVVIASLIAAEFFLRRRAISPEGCETHPSRATFTLMCAVGVAIKLSFAAFAAGLWMMDAFSKRSPKNATELRERHWVALLVAASVLLPWIIRGYIQSGYPAYPLTLAAIPVEWTMPADMAAHDVKIIKAVARDGHRDPDEVLADDTWFRPWLSRTFSKTFDVSLPLALFLVGGLVALRRRKLPPGVPALTAATLVSLVVWFPMAPDPRFAAAAFWILGAIGMASALGQVGKNQQRPNSRDIFLIICTATLFSLTTQVFMPGLHRGVRPLPAVKVDLKATDSGLEVVVPPDELCWDGPLLCMPRLDTRLRLRRERNLAAGFAAKP